MNQTIVIDTKTGEQMIQAFRDLKTEVSLLRATLSSVTLSPKYGTELWWEVMDNQAKKDIGRGLGVTLKSAKDIDAFFKNLQ